MYKLLLILKYLARKITPLCAAGAVTLCTAMVIIVISVMGGWLNMARTSAHKAYSDVIISGGLRGFPDYLPMLDGLRKLPAVEAAAPILRSYGLMNIGGIVRTVEVDGIDPPMLDQVTDFKDSIYWKTPDLVEHLKEEFPGRAQMSPEEKAVYDRKLAEVSKEDFRDYAMSFKIPPSWHTSGPAKACMIPGVAVGGHNLDKDGNYIYEASTVGMVGSLTMVPVDERGGFLEPALRDFVAINEFKTGYWETDYGRVYIPFDLMQKMLKMDPYPEIDPETGSPTGKMASGRTSEILVRGRPGVPLAEIKNQVKNFVESFAATQRDFMFVPRIETWEEKAAPYLNAVEKEKGMMTVLFGIISLVAVAMIWVIFHMIVMDKTRDIGVLRAVGASRRGIMSIFLGYGLAIGVLGSALGLCLSAVIVWNLNEIQDLLFKVFGFKMWDPAVYAFDRIPSTLNPHEVTVILICGVLSGVIGSLIPAFLAARQNPVEALRYE